MKLKELLYRFLALSLAGGIFITSSPITIFADEVEIIEEEDTGKNSRKHQDVIPSEDGDTKYVEDDIYEYIKSTITYKEEYAYEDALEQSFTAAQYAVPMETTLYDILLSENLGKELNALVDSNGVPYEINYRKLYKSADGSDVQATVADLLTLDSSGKGSTFYVKVLTDVDIDEDTGSVSNEQYSYYPVYNSNPYTLFYLNLFMSNANQVFDKIMQCSTAPLDVDQYGNICIDGTNNGQFHRVLVVPNIANPALTKDGSFYLPTRRFLSGYDTNLLGSLTNSFSNEQENTSVFSPKLMKRYLGDALDSYRYVAYDISNSDEAILKVLNNLSMKDTTDYPVYKEFHFPLPAPIVRDSDVQFSQAFTKFLFSYRDNYNTKVEEADTSKLMLFSLGNGFKDTCFYNNMGRPWASSIGYTDVLDCISSKKGTFAVLDGSRLYMGESGLQFTSYKIHFQYDASLINLLGGSNEATLAILTHDASYSGIISLLNGGATWGDKNISSEEVAFFHKMTKAYFNAHIKEDFLYELAFFTDKSTVKQESSAPASEVTESRDQSKDQQINTIVDAAYQFATKPGSSMVAMGTSKMSKYYYNVMSNISENFLFHTNNIYESDSFIKMVKSYMLFLLLINTLYVAIQGVALLRGKGVDITMYFYNLVRSMFICTIPMFVLFAYVMACNFVTEKVFTNTFLYWSLIDIESQNVLNSADRNIEQEMSMYFRESAASLNLTNKGSVYLYRPRSDGSYLSLVSLTDIANESDFVRGLPLDSNMEAIMANQGKYSESVFYYFYDTLRYHFYNYYYDELQDEGTLKSSWENNLGLIGSTGNFLKMIGDPAFLYGSSYDAQSMGTFEDDIDSKTLSELVPQDLCGLTYLFSGDLVTDRQSYRESIYSCRWFKLMQNSKRIIGYMQNGDSIYDNDMLDYTNYPNETIRAAWTPEEKYMYSHFEFLLNKVNIKVAKDIQILQDYPYFTDESLLFMAAMIMTFDFNDIMEHGLNTPSAMMPTTFYAASFNTDTIFRSVFLDNNSSLANINDVLSVDIMEYIESNAGGLPVQGLVLVGTYLAELAGIIKECSIYILFALAIFVFTIFYNILQNYFNKAWVGLISLSFLLLVVHTLFLACVNIICIPNYTVIRTSVFSNYAPFLRIIALIVVLILQVIAILFILYFAFRHYRDLGGQIIADNIESVGSVIQGNFSSNGKIQSTSDATKMNSDRTYISSNNEEDEKVVSVSNSATSKQEDQVSNIAREAGEAAIKDLVEENSKEPLSSANTTKDINEVKEATGVTTASVDADELIAEEMLGTGDTTVSITNENSTDTTGNISSSTNEVTSTGHNDDTSSGGAKTGASSNTNASSIVTDDISLDSFSEAELNRAASVDVDFNQLTPREKAARELQFNQFLKNLSSQNTYSYTDVHNFTESLTNEQKEEFDIKASSLGYNGTIEEVLGVYNNSLERSVEPTSVNKEDEYADTMNLISKILQEDTFK